jgi:hypothetical protein
MNVNRVISKCQMYPIMGSIIFYFAHCELDNPD